MEIEIIEQLNDLRETVERLKETHESDISSLRKEVAQLHTQLSWERNDSHDPFESSRWRIRAKKVLTVSETIDTIVEETTGEKNGSAYMLRGEARTPVMPSTPSLTEYHPTTDITLHARNPRAPPSLAKPCSNCLMDDASIEKFENESKSNVDGRPLAPAVEVPPVAPAVNDESDALEERAKSVKKDTTDDFNDRKTRSSKASSKASTHGTPMVHRGRGAAKIFAENPVRLNHHYMRAVCEEEYQFCESVWDAALFVGDDVFSHCTSIFIFLMLLFMIGVLIVFNGIVYQDFTNWDAFNQDQRDGLRDWRTQESHLLTYANQVTGTTMNARVCALDDSLMMSSEQKDTVGDLELYLPKKDGGWIDQILSGPVLSSMALFVWYMAILKELHNILQLLRALKHVHRGSTHITHEDVCFHVRSISSRRAAYGIILTSGRIAMCFLLLLSGTGYIIHTISMEDILLNCVALGIILDVDELMFESLAPSRVRCFMQNLQPVEVPPWPRYKGADVAATIVLFALVAGLAVVNIFEMVPFIDDLYDALDILCGGNQNFLVQPDAVGLAYVIPGNPYGFEAGIDQSLLADAVEQGILANIEDLVQSGWLMWGGVGWEPSEKYTIEANLDRMRSKMEEQWFNQMRYMARWQTAEDKSLISASGRVEASVKFLRELLDNTTASCDEVHKIGIDTPLPVPSCYQLWNEHASTVNRVQALCPVGCGCYTPWYGTIYKNRGGCPIGAYTSDEYQKHLDHFPCDNPSDHLNATILDWLNSWRLSTELHLHATDAQKITFQSPSSPEFCDSVFEVLGHEETMAPAICPIHFGCKYKNFTPGVNVEPYCPRTC